MNTKELEKLNKNLELLNNNFSKLFDLMKGQSSENETLHQIAKKVSLVNDTLVLDKNDEYECELNEDELFSGDNALIGMISTAYNNAKDIISHDKAKVKINTRGVFVSDINGDFHQVNAKSIQPESSYIQRVSYLEGRKTLQVKFAKGTIYNYSPKNMSEKDWATTISCFMNSRDVSVDFHNYIRNNKRLNYEQVF